MKQSEGVSSSSPFSRRRGVVYRRIVSGFWLLSVTRVLAGNFYSGTSPATVPWPGGIVPYEFTNTLTAAQQETYLDGLREWQLAANVRFAPHTNQTHWILFTYNTNGFDNVSAGANPQVISVSSLSRAQVCHEMGHSFGFTHENIRPDATNFITVLTNHIATETSNIFWFTVDPTSVTNGNYDFESVMHLGWDFDSTNPGVLATQQPRPPYFPRYQFRLGNYCLSPGDRAALAYLYGPPAVPLTNVVTTAADVGPGSLRAAIYYATDHPGTIIRFNIATNDPGYSNGVFNLHLTGLLPPLVANGTGIDGSTQPGFAGKPLIVVDGSQMIPEAYAPGTATGLLIYAANCQIKNLSFQNFKWNGLTLLFPDATNNTISGCWFGLDASGTNAAPNAYQGILVASGAGGNTIGSTNPAGRNVISGNLQYGVYLTNTTANVILGNYIGVDASGETALGNQLSGIGLFGGNQNVIGGTVAGAGNVLSGNSQYGIDIGNPVATGNWVQGNLIGLDAAGTNGIGNGNGYGGVLLDAGATGNTIGGTVAGARNVISGNAPAGVFFAGNTTSGNVVEGNYIGTDITGTNAVPNSLAGVYLPFGTPDNIIGGTVVGARNVISGNYYGVYLAGPGTSGNVIEGNYIGISPDGTKAVGSAFAGIIIFAGANNNTIGGASPGAGNIIAGCFGDGLYLSGAGTTGNWIQGNDIGTDATGTNGLPNYNGLILFGGTTNNIIGLKPDGSGRGNVIAFNNGDGVQVGDTNTMGIAIRGNSIFGNGGLGIDLVNGGNNLQNFPIITNATAYPASTVISGTLNSLAHHTYLIDVYRNAANVSGDGEFYAGTVSVTTDGSGNGTFALTVAGNYTGQYFTATATSAGGDTSEFSADLLAVPGPAAQFTGPYQLRTNGFAFSLTLQTNFNYRIQAATNLAPPVAWTDLTNFIATNSPFSFTDHSATNYRVRFYRAVSP